MIIKELFNKLKFEDVFPYIKEIHENYEKNRKSVKQVSYQLIWNEIKKTKATAKTPFIVCLSGCDNKKEHIYAVVDTRKHHYSLYCTDWAEWLRMRVDEESIENFSQEYFLAHVVFEMSYRGHYIKEEKKK